MTSSNEAKTPLANVSSPKDNPLDAARAAFRNSVGFQVNFLLYSGLTSAKAIDHICDAADKLLAAAHPTAQAGASPQERNSTTVTDHDVVGSGLPDSLSPESESSILAEIRMRRRSITCEQSPPWSDELGEIGTNEPPLFVARTDRRWQDSPIAACYDGYTARFIANAPTDIDTLIGIAIKQDAEIKSLRSIIDSLKAEIGRRLDP